MHRVNTSRLLVSDIALDARLQGMPESDFSGDCLDPVELHLFGYPDKLLVDLGIEPDRNVAERIKVRCRKCAPCLMARSKLWTARAIDECRFASRSWFGTLTLAPDHAFGLRVQAQAAATRSGVAWSELDGAEQFRRTANEASAELTLWLKRVRKNSGARLRYLLVCEAHKSGVPHWHCLIHEHQGEARKRTLDKAWRLGFSQFRLVDGDGAAAAYVCKYLAKSALTRVRASQKYGTPIAVSRSAAFVEAAQAVSEAARLGVGLIMNQTGLGAPGSCR